MLAIRVSANHWLQHFIAKFHQYFQGKDLILCFELNILDDLKIVEYRTFYLMQQKQFLFCVFFLTIINILQVAVGMFDIYRIFSYNLYYVYNSSYCLFQSQQLLSYLDISWFSQPATYKQLVGTQHHRTVVVVMSDYSIASQRR